MDEPNQMNLHVSLSSEHGEKVEYVGPDEEAVVFTSKTYGNGFNL